jgi:hypothetical protein
MNMFNVQCYLYMNKLSLINIAIINHTQDNNLALAHNFITRLILHYTIFDKL